MIDNFGVTFTENADNEAINFEAFLDSFEKSFKEEERAKINMLINDILKKSIFHIEKYDLLHIFESQHAEYFESNTEAEILGFVKQRQAKIKEMLIFQYCDIYFNEIRNTFNKLKPYLHDDVNALFGMCVEENKNEAKYRILIAR